MKKWRNALMVHFHHNWNITLLPIFQKRNVIFLAVIFQHCNKKNVIAAVEQCTSCKKKVQLPLFFSEMYFGCTYSWAEQFCVLNCKQAVFFRHDWDLPEKDTYPKRRPNSARIFGREKKREHIFHMSWSKNIRIPARSILCY